MALHGLYELSILLMLLLCLLLFTAGWGRLAFRMLGVPSEDLVSVDSLWLGLIFIVAFLGLAHFLVPINWSLRILIALVGLLGVYLTPNLRAQVTASVEKIRRHPGAFLFILIVIVGLCLKSLQAPRNFDSALYHFQTIRWLNEFPIVYGLGNLHGRLAFNQSYFNLLALLQIEPLTSKGYAAAAVFMVLLCAGSIYKLYDAVSRGNGWLVLMLMSGLGLTLDQLSSPTPDSAISIIQLQIYVYLISLYVRYESAKKIETSPVLVVAFLAYFILTIKISAFAFACGCLLISLPLFNAIRKVDIKVLAVSGGVGLLLLAIHFSRGYVLSGAPFFPSQFGADWSLPWAMPQESVKGDADWIYSWARLPGADPATVLGNWNWLGPWLNNVPLLAKNLFCAGIILFGLNVILLCRAKINRTQAMPYLLYVPLVLALLFWFFTAPDFRFLGAVSTLFIMVPGWLCWNLAADIKPIASLWSKCTKDHADILTASAALLIFLYFLGVRSITLNIPEHLSVMAAHEQKVNMGVLFYQPRDGLCWNNPLPCAPFVSPSLKLRVPEGGIGAGFTLK
jgi:hypothetical protein